MPGSPVAELLNSFSRSSLFLDIPHPHLGALRLDVANMDVILTHPNGKMTEDMLADAERRFQAAHALWDVSDPSQSIEGMREITHRYPLWGKGHGALYDVQKHLGQTDEALYHFVQLVVVQPTFANFSQLGMLLGQAGRFDASRVALEYLLCIIDEAPSSATAGEVFRSLLVTLTRLQQGARMVEVADKAIAHQGPQLVFEYQAVLGHILAQQPDAARARLRPLLVRVPASHPLVGKLNQMRQMLSV